MPITKSARQALKKDRKRNKLNKPILTLSKSRLLQARKNPNSKTISQAFSALDKAAKKKVIKKGKANRLKSRLAKIFTKARLDQKKSEIKKPVSKKVNKAKTTKPKK